MSTTPDKPHDDPKPQPKDPPHEPAPPKPGPDAIPADDVVSPVPTNPH